MSAVEALKAARSAGVSVGIDGGDLVLQASAPPPAVLAALSRHKAAIVALLRPPGPALLAEWNAGVSRLRTMDCPTGMRPDRWREAIVDAGRFLDQWGAQAAALGWSTLDVFGAHPTHPVERLDCAGLVLSPHGDQPLALSTSSARMRKRSGAILTYYRRPRSPALPLWELQ